MTMNKQSHVVLPPPPREIHLTKTLFLLLTTLLLTLSFTACKESGDDDSKKITITGIAGKGFCEFEFELWSDDGDGIAYVEEGFDNPITADSVSFLIYDGNEYEKPWTGSGSYYLYAEFDDEDYLYTGGKTFAQLGITSEDDWGKLPKYNFSSAESVIPFSHFVFIPY